MLVRRRDVEGAERAFAALTEKSVSDAYNDLQYLVQDYIDVHRVVLAWRAWSLLDLAGKENAHTLLRQSVRFCCDEEKHAKNDALRVLLPRLLETKGLLSDSPKQREATDEWIEELSHTIYASNRQQAAEAVAQALGRGILARGRRRGDLAGREPARAARPRPQEGRLAARSRSAASTGPRSACMPPTPPTPGGTSRA